MLAKKKFMKINVYTPNRFYTKKKSRLVGMFKLLTKLKMLNNVYFYHNIFVV